MKTDNVVRDKSKAFALRIMRLARYLRENKREYDLASQVLRSGTSIGANIKEGIRAQTKNDFYAKLNISLKEASETEYWLELLHEDGLIEEVHFQSIYNDCQELLKLLTSIVKTKDKMTHNNVNESVTFNYKL